MVADWLLRWCSEHGHDWVDEEGAQNMDSCDCDIHFLVFVHLLLVLTSFAMTDF